jgi:hypothetical protein
LPFRRFNAGFEPGGAKASKERKNMPESKTAPVSDKTFERLTRELSTAGVRSSGERSLASGMRWEIACGGSYKDNLYCNPQVNTPKARGTKTNTIFEMKVLLNTRRSTSCGQPIRRELDRFGCLSF